MKKPFPQYPATVRPQIALVKNGVTDQISIANLKGFDIDPGSLKTSPIDINDMLDTISYNCADKLKSLNAGYNDLVEIPTSVGLLNFTELEHLNLEGNKLTCMGDISLLNNTVPKLSTVNLKNNPLSIDGLLNIKNSSESSNIMYILDEGCKATLEKIKSSPQVEEIALICLKDEDMSSEKFQELLPLIDAQMELQKILKTSIPNPTDKNSDILFAIRTIRAKLHKNENSQPHKNGNKQKKYNPTPTTKSKNNNNLKESLLENKQVGRRMKWGV